MSDDYVKMMRERVEALEKRMNRFELVHGQHVAQAIESRNQRDERIEALAAAYGPFGTHNETHNHVNKRLEKLEEKATSADCVRVHRDIAEDERQDRWHATYNAALPDAMRVLRGLNDDHEMADRAAIICGIVADRAHGPLEAKAALCTHENYSCVKERQEVEALVKAALRVRDDYAGGAHVSLASAAAMELALKPFEAVQP